MDASTLTDPDCLGPCEPGTSVTLEGLVWAESNNGMCIGIHQSVLRTFSFKTIVVVNDENNNNKIIVILTNDE